MWDTGAGEEVLTLRTLCVLLVSWKHSQGELCLTWTPEGLSTGDPMWVLAYVTVFVYIRRVVCWVPWRKWYFLMKLEIGVIENIIEQFFFCEWNRDWFRSVTGIVTFSKFWNCFPINIFDFHANYQFSQHDIYVQCCYFVYMFYFCVRFNAARCASRCAYWTDWVNIHYWVFEFLYLIDWHSRTDLFC